MLVFKTSAFNRSATSPALRRRIVLAERRRFNLFGSMPAGNENLLRDRWSEASETTVEYGYVSSWKIV